MFFIEKVKSFWKRIKRAWNFYKRIELRRNKETGIEQIWWQMNEEKDKDGKVYSAYHRIG